MTGLLEVRAAAVRYALRGGRKLTAVDGVSLSLGEGEILGLVGESGCGKTSLGRAILGLARLASGEVRWEGRRIDTLSRRAFRALRGDMQLVFQDPHASFDPRMTVSESVAEPLPRRRDRRALSAPAERRPAAACRHRARSGRRAEIRGLRRAGERARRVRARPDRQPAGAHPALARLSERILVMYRGRIVESAPRQSLVRAPRHPYTRLLLDSVPDPHPAAARTLLAAVRESPSPPAAVGCPFASRCRWVLARCRESAPELRPVGDRQTVSCHRADEWPDGLAPSASP
jgi:oligopeptide/dipeptide ABC transporter ATP-binding protein